MFDFNNVNAEDIPNLNDELVTLVGKSFLTSENLPKIFKFLFNIDIKIKLSKTYSKELGKPVYFINTWEMEEGYISKLEKIRKEYFVYNGLNNYYEYSEFEWYSIIERNLIFVNKYFTLFNGVHDNCYHISYNEETFDFNIIKKLFL